MGERKQVVLCGRSASARLCASGTTASVRSSADSAATRSRWRILRAANLRLWSSADSAAVLRCRRSRRAAEEQPTCQGVGTLSQTHVAGIDALAGALICYAAWGGLPTCPRMLLRSPAFPPIDHCVTCKVLGRTGIRKPTEVCGGFKHIIYIYIYIYIYMTTYICMLTTRIYTLEGGSLTLAQLMEQLLIVWSRQLLNQFVYKYMLCAPIYEKCCLHQYKK